MYGKNIDRIYIVGEVPDFINPNTVTIIPFKQQEADTIFDKRKIIDASIHYAINNSDIQEDFLVSMDDHYIRKEVDFDNYPHYVRNRFIYGIYMPIENFDDSNKYINFLIETSKVLDKYNLSLYNFILHRNMYLNKTTFNKLYNEIKEIKELGIETFALCNNYLYTQKPFKFEIVEDCKVSGNEFIEEVINKDVTFFSSHDMTTYCKMFDYMMELYPNKSKYEL